MGGKYERVITIARALDKVFAEDVTTDIPGFDMRLVEELHTLLADLPEDEPIFVLRAQDRVAPHAVRAWTMFAEQCGADSPTVGSGIRNEADMIVWQDKNPLKVKIPTTPPQTG